ncbi:hypothetical protein PIB30_010314 [Stylosanthes scabra]|uniref:Uncharacterized protein n=1 Tax=Stylosanthes scabra TaxID=79078 RepID=A0ABU6U5C4_9FABA|nr:hypothetical protein [Stylosanthes scabra]
MEISHQKTLGRVPPGQHGRAPVRSSGSGRDGSDTRVNRSGSWSKHGQRRWIPVNTRVNTGSDRRAGVEKSMRKAKKNIGSKDGIEKACESGGLTKEARMRSREMEL